MVMFPLSHLSKEFQDVSILRRVYMSIAGGTQKPPTRLIVDLHGAYGHQR